MFRIAVLSSGMSRGTNLRAMAEYFKRNNLPVKISFVVRTKENAPINLVCSQYGIPCHFIEYRTKEKFEEKVLYLCHHYRIQLLALSGFLKKLSPLLLRELAIPVLNIHPALLPKYGGNRMYGMAVHQAVYDAKETISGATVHRVDSHYDHGKIIAQMQTDVSDCKSPEEIADTVLKIEHQLYGKAIWDYLTQIYS